MKLSEGKNIWVLLRVVVGFIFAFAGFSKLAAPVGNFEAALLKYGVFPSDWVGVIARVVPWLEWLLGSLLVLGYATRVTATGVALLSIGFLLTLGSSRLFLESGGSDCGCFGQSWLHFTIRQIFFVDLVSLTVSLRLAAMKRASWSLDSFLLKEAQKP